MGDGLRIEGAAISGANIVFPAMKDPADQKRIYEVEIVDTEADIIMRTNRVIAKSRDEVLLKTVLGSDEKARYDEGRIWVGVRALYTIGRD